MVITSLTHAAVTPAGKLVAAPIPIAPVVACVMLMSTVLIHKVGLEEAAPEVLSAVTVIVPTAFTVPQPPVSSML